MCKYIAITAIESVSVYCKLFDLFLNNHRNHNFNYNL